jgi:hypothetical protein
MFDSWGEFGEGPGAGAVATLDRTRLSASDRVTVMQTWARRVAHAQAELYASIVAVAEAAGEAAGGDVELAQDLAASEIRAALCLTRRAADAQLDLAQELVERHPRVWEALHRGEIDLPRARVIIDQTTHLDQETAQRVADTVLHEAGKRTTGQLRARIQRLVISLDPDAARDRYEARLVDRRVVIQATDAGTANLLGMDLPAADTNAAIRRINRLAQTVKTGDDPRTLDQIRADIFLDLLNGRQPGQSGGDGAVVDIRVDLTTLTGLDDNPAEIPGWGPVISDIARQVAEEQAKTQWQVTVTDQNRDLVHTGTTRRRPSAAQRRTVEAKAMTCVFPGCRMPARQSDLDHRQAWAEDGPTQEHNLEPLCRHDHQLKHNGWKLDKLDTGQYQWTSPLGLKYTVDPRGP